MRIKQVWLIHGDGSDKRPDVIQIKGEYGDYEVDGQLLEEVLIQSGQLCGECGGSGEVSVDEDDGEGHLMRGVGTRKCICQVDKDDHDPDRD